jgi:hypothetical protein
MLAITGFQRVGRKNVQKRFGKNRFIPIFAAR